MKTETKIAEENIKNWEFTKPQDKSLWRLNIYLNKSQSHKASCQRFLEFLKNETEPKQMSLNLKQLKKSAKEKIWEKKITDLQNAIKKYVEVGI